MTEIACITFAEYLIDFFLFCIKPDRTAFYLITVLRRTMCKVWLGLSSEEGECITRINLHEKIETLHLALTQLCHLPVFFYFKNKAVTMDHFFL